MCLNLKADSMGKEVSTKKESSTQLGPVQSEISFIDEMEDKDINKLFIYCSCCWCISVCCTECIHVFSP